MKLRSGKLYVNTKMVTTTTTTTVTTTTVTTTTTTITTITTTTPSVTTPISSLNSPAIKLLQHDTTIPKFSGEGIDSYTPSQFLQLCEDVISNSQINSGADKISFVRSHLVPGSLASELMSATAFDPKVLQFDYDKFKVNFLQIFGVPQPKDNLQWIFEAAQTMSNQSGTVDFRRAQARSAQLANQAVSSLKASNWFVNGTLDEDSFRLILEYIFYIQLLTPAERHTASTLPYTKGESLLDFSSKLAVKLRSQQPAYVAANSIDPPSTTGDASQPLPKQKFNSSVCQYCHKVGHTQQRCFLKQRHERQPRSQPTGSSVKSQAPRSDNDNRSRQLSRDHKPQRYRSWSRGSHTEPSKLALLPPAFYCMIHGNGNHPTEECRTILRLQKEHTVTPPSNFQQAYLHRVKD